MSACHIHSLAPDFAEGFDRLDALLHAGRHYWQLRPYHHFDYPWRDNQPALADWVDGLDDARVERLDGDHGALAAALAPFIADAGELHAWSEVPAGHCSPIAAPRPLSHQVPGRKWRQIQAFAAALPDHRLPLLEWCAGKGHLGRLLAWRFGQPVTSVERDPALCAAGHALAGRGRSPVTFRTADVLTPAAAALVRSAQHAVALHACGELHQRLLRLAAEAGTGALSVAPCCYHLIPDEHYRPLSRHGRSHSRLRLQRSDLQLPSQELVTGGARTRRLRDNEVHWRLGFDTLQRELTGRDRYLPVPPVRVGLLNRDFEGFCRWAAAVKGLTLPPDTDFARHESLGRARRRLVRRLGLIRHLYRRPLETWLLLDRALYLREQGYRVTLTRFCDRRLTPRNLLLQARLS